MTTKYWHDVTTEDMHVTTYTLYSKPNCPACVQLKSKLIDRGDNFIEESLDTPEKIAAFKALYPGVRSVPYLVTEMGNPVTYR